MRILSIDPGFGRIGLAVMENNAGDGHRLIHSECFIIPKNISPGERLKFIGQKICEIIDCLAPNTLAIETLFFNTNEKTALGVAEVRGVALYLASAKNLDIFEYSPLQVKCAVTGYGRATKKQVIDMIERLVPINESKKRLDDEYDAIAVGITCLVSKNIRAGHKESTLGRLTCI